MLKSDPIDTTRDTTEPYEKFKSLPEAAQYLKAAITFDILDAQANHLSDNDAAAALQQAKQLLFQTIHEQQVA